MSTSPPDPSPKPLRVDAARNRARVLAAAEELFAQEGTDAQLLDIARRAGVGAGTVYRHFPSKEALLAEVVAARISELLDDADADAAREAAIDPGQALREFWDRAVARARENVAVCDAFTAGTGEELSIPPALRERYRATLERLLIEAQRAGAARAELTVGDVVALLSAAVLAEQRGDASGRLAALIGETLRAAPVAGS